MNLKKLYLATIVSLAAFLTIAAIDNTQDEPVSNKSLIKFSHKLHVEMTDCETCHVSAPEAASLSERLLPTMDECAECHDIEDEDNCETCHYEEIYEPLQQHSSKLIFNHQFHLGQEKLYCTNCHTGLDKVNYAFESTGSVPEMAGCISCHNESDGAPSECVNCHTNTGELYPQSHMTANFIKQHKFAGTLGKNDCSVCHSESFCEACHVSTTGITEANTADDFYAPYSPYKLTDRKNNQQLELVHGINYRFTHGVDAKLDGSKCSTCHQTESFCAECHNSENKDFAMEGNTPASHTKPGFTTIGVGSGGGEHALIARRNIESCAACHDVEGSDPSCILCHSDPDGIQNTNPKTHISGFMRDEEGDWHSDYGSVCFTCHTDVNAHPGGTPGIGFCGYCHGQQ